MNQYESRFGIGQEVNFKYEDKEKEGIVVAVRFTKSKVFYEILDECDADVYQYIDSVDVSEVDVPQN